MERPYPKGCRKGQSVKRVRPADHRGDLRALGQELPCCSQILVQRFPGKIDNAYHHCFVVNGAYPAAQRQCPRTIFAATIGTALLGQGYAVTLPIICMFV